MHVLVLIHEFPPIGGGGGQVARDICRGLVERGHEVTILTAHFRGMPRQEIIEGIRVIRVPSLRNEPYRAGLLTMSAYVLAGLWSSLWLIRNRRPDVIHVHFAVPAGALAWAIGRLTGVPYILTTHLGDVPGGVPEKTDTWFRWLYPFTPPIWHDAKRVVAVSDYTRQLALKHYPIDIQVIPNGVDLLNLKPGNTRTGNPPRIIFAGRFMQQKNPLRVVETLARLKDLSWTCTMIGDGPLRPGVEREIAKNGLEDRFTLPGWITPNAVVDWLAKSDILFMPSLSEGFPLVGVQAIAMGLAVVCSRIGGFIDIVEQGKNGFMINPNDTDGFAHTIRTLLTNRELLKDLQKASTQKAKIFDLVNIVDQYEKVLFQAAEQ